MQGVAYALPTILLVSIFFVLPLLLVGRMSISDWSLLSGDHGLNAPDNYTAIESNRLFWPAVVFTIEYTVLVTVLLIGLGLGLAILVQEGSRYVGGLRTIFLLPVAVGLASASLLFWGFYSPSIGPISPLLEQMGMTTEPISFLGSPLAALLSTTFLIVWKFAGLYMLILLVGLQAIPPDVYEAAAVDGASRRQTLRRITLPLLAAVAGPGADPLCHRLAPGLRPVLHPHQGRAGEQHRHRGAAHLPGGLPAAEPGHGRGHLDRRAGRVAGAQRGAVPWAARIGARLMASGRTR